MLQLPNKPHDGRAKDGETRKALGVSEGMVGMDRMVGSLTARPHESRRRLPVLMSGMLFASGWCTVTTWPGAAGISTDYADVLHHPPCRSGTQGRIGGLAAPCAGPADCAAARPAAGGDRRFSNDALWAEERGRCYTSQSDSRSRGPALSHTVTFGSRGRWPCGIRCGARLLCRCGPCSTFVRSHPRRRY